MGTHRRVFARLQGANIAAFGADTGITGFFHGASTARTRGRRHRPDITQMVEKRRAGKSAPPDKPAASYAPGGTLRSQKVNQKRNARVTSQVSSTASTIPIDQAQRGSMLHCRVSAGKLALAMQHRGGEVLVLREPVIQDGGDMQPDESQQQVEQHAVPVGSAATGIETHVQRQRSGLDAVDVHREQPEHDLRGQQREQRDHTERAEWIVAGHRLPRAAHVGEHRARSVHEAREACGGTAEESPVQPERHQPGENVTAPAVPLEAAGLPGPPRQGDPGDQQPVDQARGQVPDPHAGPGRRRNFFTHDLVAI